MQSEDGYVNVLGFNLFYRSFGSGSKGTILCLHGGPGGNHEYLLPLSDLSEHGYRVVFYDQLGCGKSDLPKDIALFNIERAVKEVEAFRKVMKLGRVHLMGSSYGGLLAIAYALSYQKNLKSLITTGGLANVPLAVAEMQRLKSRLSTEVRKTLEKYERLGEYENEEYVVAVMEFYKKHLCRMPNWPKELTNSLEQISKPVYHVMNGPNEFTIIGNIRYWNVSDRLREIKVPTLVTGGRYDEVTSKVAKDIHNGIQGSQMVIFSKSAHLPMWEEREMYTRVLLAFLEKIEPSES